MGYDKLADLGFPLQWISSTAWTCGGKPVYARWLGQDGDPQIAFVCSTKQLFLLGVYCRLVAVMCLLIVSRKQSRGEGRLVDATDGLHVSPISRLTSNALICFFVLLTHLE